VQRKFTDEAEQTAKTITSLLHLLQTGVALDSALKTGYLLFSAVFAFEADDCGWLVG